MCVRVSEIITFSFVLSLVRECKSECEKPTIGIRALRSTCGDAMEDRGGKLVINWRFAEIRESGDKL